MSKFFSVRRVLPIAVSAIVIVLAARFLLSDARGLRLADVLRGLRDIPVDALVIGGVLVAVLYTALGVYEAIVADYVAGPVSRRRAAMGGVLAASIGHALGLGTVSGGAIRYRVYRAAGMRPIDIGKMIVLVAMPYPGGLGLMLSASLLMQCEAAAPILHTSASLLRGIGLALFVLHVAYLTLVLRRREPLAFGRHHLTLPSPRLTAIQYLVGIVEVCSAASILYVLLPASIQISWGVFVGVYVLAILAGLISGAPAGLGAFEAALLALLAQVPHVAPLNQAELYATVIAYRGLLEAVPLVLSLSAFAAYELWWRLPLQRARVAAIRTSEKRAD